MMKVEAMKHNDCLPVEDVVRNNAKERRDKLLRIGLAYDLAHAKGQISATDEEKKARKKIAAKKRYKEKKEVKDKLMKEKKKRKHNENKETRKTRAAAAKRKAKAKAKEEKKKAEVKEESKDGREGLKDATASTESKSEVPRTEITSITEPEKAAEATPGEEPEASEPPSAKEADKPKESDSKDKAPTQSTLAGLPGLRINGVSISAPSSLSGISNFDDDDDDLSDLDSNVSDITSGVVEDEIAAAKPAAEQAIPPPPIVAGDDEDEFERDPWNAIAVVGLRVYSKESGVSVKVVRPRMSEEEDKDEKAEGKLDVDDSAADAVPDVEEKKEGEVKPGNAESEGSGVIV